MKISIIPHYLFGLLESMNPVMNPVTNDYNLSILNYFRKCIDTIEKKYNESIHYDENYSECVLSRTTNGCISIDKKDYYAILFSFLRFFSLYFKNEINITPLNTFFLSSIMTEGEFLGKPLVMKYFYIPIQFDIDYAYELSNYIRCNSFEKVTDIPPLCKLNFDNDGCLCFNNQKIIDKNVKPFENYYLLYYLSTIETEKRIKIIEKVFLDSKTFLVKNY